MNHAEMRMGPGLSADEVLQLRARYGANRIAGRAGPRWTGLLAHQFANPMVLLLAVAAFVALMIGERIDALAIVAVVLVNAALGFVQEWRAETALAALGTMLDPMTRVIRDGREQAIPAEELVPGDLARLIAGDSVTADMRLLPGPGVQVDESALTGESVPVDRTGGDEVSQGTLVLTGRAYGQVTATGEATRFGRIAALTRAAEGGRSVLQSRIGRLSRQIGIAALLIALLVLGLGIAGGEAITTMIMTATALAVSIVPEGLPAVLTVTLALGAAMLVRRKALVRRLPALETLGAATVICTDKTGTLTGNRMTAVRIWTPAGSYEVSGVGYGPEGTIEADGEERRATDDPMLERVLATSRLCNASRLEQDGEVWRASGSPTEAALLTLALKGRYPEPAADAAVAETPFSSERKRMSVLVRQGDDHVLHAKGAPESIVSISDTHQTEEGIARLDDEAREAAIDAYQEMARDGLRVIALASRPAAAEDTAETNMTLIGLVGLIDPPRSEVPGAVAQCRAAGVRVLMITGDGPETAAAIGRGVGLGALPVLTSDEIGRLSEEALARRLEGDVIFARTKPEDKQRIVRALQSRGHVVGMTGDGVNDAPALKAADIGIAMGERGTEVARQAADLVLLDDNFATIVAGIAEGRRQFDNIRKFTIFLLASNLGEVIALTGSLVLGWPLMFSVAQLLWINLVTDSLVALALGLERGEPHQMRRPPRGREDRILDRFGLLLLLAFGTYSGVAVLWLYGTLLQDETQLARSAAFTALIFIEIATVFAFRSFHAPILVRRPFSNPALLVAAALSVLLQIAALLWPPLMLLLGVQMPPPQIWVWIALLLLPILTIPEATKLILSRRDSAPGPGEEMAALRPGS